MALLYATAFVFCAAAIAVAMTGAGGIGFALLAVEFVVLLAMRRLGLAAEARALAAAQRAETERWVAHYLGEAEAAEVRPPPDAGPGFSRGA